MRSHRIRKELAGISPETSAAADYGAGIYEEAWTRRTYAALLDHAERLLVSGESVVIDASWGAAAALGERMAADVVALRCDSPIAVAAKRLRTRPHGLSDANQAIAERMAAAVDPWPEAVTIDKSGPVERAIAQAGSAVRPHGLQHVWSRRPRLSPD